MKMLGIVAVGIVRDTRKFSGHPCRPIGRIARSSLRYHSFLVSYSIRKTKNDGRFSFFGFRTTWEKRINGTYTDPRYISSFFYLFYFLMFVHIAYLCEFCLPSVTISVYMDRVVWNKRFDLIWFWYTFIQRTGKKTNDILEYMYVTIHNGRIKQNLYLL